MCSYFIGCRREQNEAQLHETGINRYIKHIGIVTRDKL